jgi:hypothetical protein
MFEASGGRFGDLLLRGIDCALEFATLGEYRLVAPSASTRASGTAPQKQRPGPPLARTVMPATAAARLRLELAAEAAVRDRACEARSVSERRSRAVESPPRRRMRGGSAPAPPQLCIWPSWCAEG